MRRATEVVDGLVDHFAAQGETVWDVLYGNAKQPQAPFLKASFAAFLLTPDGKRWLRHMKAFDSFYRGVLQHCDETGA